MPPPKTTKSHGKCEASCSNSRNNNFIVVPLPSTSTEKIHFKCAVHTSKIVSSLNSLRLDERFCDVEIRAGEKVFKAHKVVLSASSAYFHAMFTGGLSESDQNTVELHAIEPYILEILIDYIYSGDVFVSQSNIQQLMVAADMLELVDVVNECIQFYMTEIHPFNAVGIYRFSDMHNFHSLRDFALEYIEVNFVQVMDEEEIYELDKDGIIKFLQSENLHVESEYQVFRCAFTWINCDIPQRRRFVFEILKHVRLPLLTLGLLERTANEECPDMSLKVALKSIHSDLALQRGCLVPLEAQPRRSLKRDIFLVGGCKREPDSYHYGSGENNLSPVQRYDTFKREWTESPDIAVHRLVPGVATLNGALYVAGGEKGSHILASVERFSKDENCWRYVASMNVPRCDFGLCALDNYLYALGGWVGEDIVASIERYDPHSDVWTEIGSLPEPRFSMGVVGYHGRIYLVGGCLQHKRYLSEILSYDPVTGNWRQHTCMSTPRSQMAVAVIGDYLYVVGGENRHEILNTVERYSFRKNKWTTLPTMLEARSRPAVVAVNGVLYAIGGSNMQEDFYRQQVTLSSVECYDPKANMWRSCGNMRESRAEAGAVLL